MRTPCRQVLQSLCLNFCWLDKIKILGNRVQQPFGINRFVAWEQLDQSFRTEHRQICKLHHLISNEISASFIFDLSRGTSSQSNTLSAIWRMEHGNILPILLNLDRHSEARKPGTDFSCFLGSNLADMLVT